MKKKLRFRGTYRLREGEVEMAQKMNNKRGSGLKYLFSGTLHLPVTAKSNHHYIFLNFFNFWQQLPSVPPVFFFFVQKNNGVGGRGKMNSFFFRSGLLFSLIFIIIHGGDKRILFVHFVMDDDGIGSWKRRVFHDPSFFRLPQQPTWILIFSSNAFFGAVL